MQRHTEREDAEAKRGSAANAASKAKRGSEAGKAGLFLRSTLFDFFIVWVTASALVSTASFAFESAAGIRGIFPLIMALTLPLLLVMYAGSWSKRTVAPAAVVVVVVSGIMVAAGMAFSSPEVLYGEGGMVDDPDNYLIFALVLIAVTVLTFLLSRRTLGSAVLFVLGIAVCCMVQFLYRDWMAENNGLPITLVVFVGTGMIFVYQTYRASLLQAARAKKATFAGAFLFSGGLAAICVFGALGLFTLLIQPLGLTTPDVRPFQEIFAQPVVEYSGVYASEEIESDDLLSDDTNDEEDDANQDSEGSQDDNDEHENAPLAGLQRMVAAFNPNSFLQQFDPHTFAIMRTTALVLLVLAVVAVVAGVAARRALRAYRLRKMEPLPRENQVLALYDFFVLRFKRLGLGKTSSATPMEYALTSEDQTELFSSNERGVSFVRVTDIYQSTCYGGEEVSDDDYEDVLSFYRSFFANARKQVGSLKWLWKFWRI